jgi:hypothetical protein
MILKIGLKLLCSYYLYAPEMTASKIVINNVPAIVLFMEGKHVLVSYSFQDNGNIHYIGDHGKEKYEMVEEEDLQLLCREK